MTGITSEIIELRAGTASPPLFCFHYGNFQPMAGALACDHAIYGLRTLGLESVDFDLSVQQLAAMHLDRIRSVQTEGPYALLGYSFGGLVAYEMASQLLRAGDTILLLALFDAPNPDFHRRLSAAELSVVRRKYVADRKAKYLNSLRQGRFDRLALDLAKLATRALAPLTLRANRILGRLWQRSAPRVTVETRINAIWHAYSPPSLDVPLVLFRSQGRDAEFGDHTSMGWDRVVKQGVEVRFAQGTHETMMSRDNAVTLAELVSPFIGRAGRPATVPVLPNRV